MASWETGAQSSTSSTVGEINNYKSGRESTRTSGAGYGKMEKVFDMLKGEYSIVGINANQVPAMREAIRNYVSAIQTHLDGIQAEVSADNAFRGEEVQAAVAKYLVTVQDYCKGLVSYLLTFSDKLKDVEEAWTKYTADMAQNVGTATGAFANTQNYTEKK